MDDDLDAHVREALDRIEAEGPSALDEICSGRPELADDIRDRIRLLGDYGLLDDPDAAPDVTLTAGMEGRRLGDFRLVRRLGDGGMGVVFLAEQVSLGREVAVKLIRSDQLDHPSARQRFRREVDLVARLKHPAIVPIHAVGEADGMPYFAMERIEGCTLEALLDALRDRDPTTLDASQLPEQVAHHTGSGASPGPEWRPAPDWRRFALETARSVARALEHAHRRGVLHRDVKPSNIMIATDGRVFLTDFGLGQARDDVSLTQSGSVFGSLPYLSPERVRGEAADERADVYGLGATLYEMLTLRAPYQADSAELLAARIVEGPPTSPRRANRLLSKDDATVALTSLEPDLDRRYASAAAFAEDLDALLHGREIRARPIGPLVRLGRFAARHPGPTLAAALAFVLFVVAPSAFSLWQVRTHERLTRAYDEALREQSRAILNLRSAQKAVELILHETASDLLPDVPQMAKAREKLLESAITFYEPLLAQQPEDRRARFELAMMRRSLGDIYLELFRLDEARREFDGQLETLEALLDETTDDDLGDPTRRELFHQLGSTHAQLGGLEQSLTRLDAAQARYESGIEWLDRANAIEEGSLNTWMQRAQAGGGLAQLLRERGDATGARDALDAAIRAATRAHEPNARNRMATDTLAKMLSIRGALLHDDGAFGAAAECFARALDVLRPVLGADAMIGSKLTFVTLLQNQGTILVKLGRSDEAVPVLKEGIEHLEQLTMAFPGQGSFTRILAQTWNTLGLAYSILGGSDAEVDAYRSAVALHRELAESGTDGLESIDAFALALSNLASSELKRGDLEAAEAATTEALHRFDEAERIAPGVPMRQSLRQQALANLARVRVDQERYPEAARILRDTLALGVRDPRVPAACAEIWMTIAEHAEEAIESDARTEALDALRLALRHGFDDLEALRSSPALAPLCETPEFEAMLRDVRRP